MTTLEEPTTAAAAVTHRRLVHLLPLSPRVPASTDRHFEQYLIDHHHYPKLPSIAKQPTHRLSIENKDRFDEFPVIEYEHHHVGSINRLLNSEQYRRSQARLIEYRQQSKIPGIALQPTAGTNPVNHVNDNGRHELALPLKDIFLDATRTKQDQHSDESECVDDASIFSNDADRRRRAKHWIKDHQFFFTEYQ